MQIRSEAIAAKVVSQIVWKFEKRKWDGTAVDKRICYFGLFKVNQQEWFLPFQMIGFNRLGIKICRQNKLSSYKKNNRHSLLACFDLFA